MKTFVKYKMKKVTTLIAIFLFFLAGCKGSKQSTDDFITVDVSKSYPEKELILQDFMDLEYIRLETTDEFLTQGVVMAVGTEIILISNRVNDGNIFVFERKTGKGLRKINRKGQGGEEYLYITEIVLDEDNNEMFVIDNSRSKIIVYDLYGIFKRSFKIADADLNTNTYNFDRDHLICYIPHVSTGNVSNIIHSCHLIISKKDGSIARKISIPFNELKRPVVRQGEEIVEPLATYEFQIIPNRGNWVLMETSSDTVYYYVPDDDKKIPIIVRTPSIRSMEPPEIFLMPTILADDYYFFATLKAEFDFTTGRGFPISSLMYVKHENAIFKPKVYNDDYSHKREVGMISRPLNHEIASSRILEAFQLVEAFKKGELKGKLKEIAAGLGAEDNPVIMLVKHKK